MFYYDNTTVQYNAMLTLKFSNLKNCDIYFIVQLLNIDCGYLLAQAVPKFVVV